MGRNAQPIDILQARGKKHLTKEEIQQRKDSEIKLGKEKLTCPMYVYSDKVARRKWEELIADYNKAKAEGIELIRSSDVGILAMYCKTFSEYIKLLDMRARVEEAVINWDEYERYFPLDFRDGINRILKIDPTLTLDTAINKKMDMLLKMEDRLFLNPLAKVKNVPKKQDKKEDPLAGKGFGNV